VHDNYAHPSPSLEQKDLQDVMLTLMVSRSPEGKQFQDVNAVNSQINSPLLPYICSLFALIVDFNRFF
jgi:hypothetical protein